MKKIQKIINLIKASQKNLPDRRRASSIGLYYASPKSIYASAAPVGFKSRAKSDYFYR